MRCRDITSRALTALPGFGRVFAHLLALLSCLLMPLQGAWAQVITDGRTATNIARNGSVSNVTTGTISQGHGINSFVSFNVGGGQTVNIHVPNGAQGTLNLINGGQSSINGLVQSMQGGAVGGHMFIANSNGFVVGPSGVIRGGSVSLSTPSQSAMDGVFGAGGISGSHVRNIINGGAGLGPGNIDVYGRIEANDRIGLQAGGRVLVDGTLNAGVGGTGNGEIIINGQQGVTLGAGARLNAQRPGGAGGDISITSPRDIILRSGARVLSQSTGAQDAGTIYVFADGSALLEEGAVISAAALGSGKGGFVEFSARNVVDAFGMIEAWSNAGEGGEILINPEIVNMTSQTTNGADLTILATIRINVLEGAVINTVGSADVGDITMTAPRIDIRDGAQLIALDGARAGDITITARLDDRITDPAIGPGDVGQNALPIGLARLTATNAVLRGGNITLRAEAFKDNLVDVEAAADVYAQGLFGPDGSLLESDALVAIINNIAGKVQNSLDAIDIENQPNFLSATARVQLEGSYINAQGTATVEALATTQMRVAPENANVAFALAASNTVAETILHDTAIDAEGGISVLSKVAEEHVVIGKSGVQKEGVDPTAFNVAIAASLRRARARTIVNGVRQPNGFDEFANLDPATSFYIPWNTGVGNDEYAILTTPGAISVASEVVKDILIQSDAVTNENAKGIALALSVDDTLVETRFGGDLAAKSGDVAITAETTVERFASRARVSGGVDAATNVSADETKQKVDEDKQQQVTGDLTSVALGVGQDTDGANGALALLSGGGGGAGGGGGGDNESRFGLALNLSSHNLRAVASAGDPDYTYETMDGTARNLVGPALRTTPDGSYGRAGGQFYADADAVDLDANPEMRIEARNTYKDIRVETLVQLGSVPSDDPDAEGALTGDSETELVTSGEKAGLIAIGIANWNSDADAYIDEGGVVGFRGLMKGASDLAIRAENNFEETEGRDEVGTWWEEYREALIETEGDNPDAETSDTGTGTGTGAGTDPDAGDGTGKGKRKGRIGSVADGEAASLTGLKPDAPGTPDTGDDDTPAANPDDAPDDADEAPAQSPVDTRMFLAESVGRGSEIGVAINIQSVNIDMDANVRTASSMLEQERYYRVDGLGPIDKDATIQLKAANTGDIIVSAGAPGTSTGGEKGGYGGAFSFATVTATSDVDMRDGTVLDLPNFDIRSEQDLLIVNTARSHGVNDDGGTGLTAGVAVTRYDAQTTISERTDVGLSYKEADKDVSIVAEDKSSVVTLAGSGVQGAKTGFSFGVALNLSDRRTTIDMSGTDLGAERDIKIAALTTGSLLASGSSHAQDKDEPEAPADDPADPADPADPDAPEAPEAEVAANDGGSAPVELGASLLGDKAEDVQNAAGGGDDGSGGGSGGGETTLAFSGDFAGTFADVETAVTLASSIDTEFPGTVEILATTDVEYGQASAVTAVAVDGVAIAGSFGLALVEHDTKVILSGSSITFFEDEASDGQGGTNIASRDSSVFDLLVTGRAGHSQDNWGIAISASFNVMNVSAETVLDNTILSNGRPNFNSGGGEGGEGGEGDGEFSEEDDGFFDEFGEGEGDFCIDAVCSDNTFGRVTSISSEANATSIVTVLAVRDEVDAEVSGGQTMGKVAETFQQAGEAAQKPQDDDAGGTGGTGGTGGGTPAPDEDKKGKGFKGISVAIAPSILSADSRTAIIDSFILVDRDGDELGEPQNSVGSLVISSKAVTDATIDASSGTIGLSFAKTDTNSLVEISRSEITAAGNGTIAISSDVRENQKVSARVGNDSRYKIAGILSLRDALNRIEIDTDRPGSDTSVLDSKSLSIAATTTHDLTFTALAEDSTSLTFAGAGVVSLAEADTRVLVGADLGNSKASISAEDKFVRYEATAAAVTGKFTAEELDSAIERDADPDGDEEAGEDDKTKVKTPGKDEDSGKDSDALSSAFANLSDETQKTADDEAAGSAPVDPATLSDEDKKKKASTSPSFVIALNLDRHDSIVETRIGGLGIDEGRDQAFDLRSARANGADVSATAKTTVRGYRKETVTKAGDVDGTSLGFVGTFALGFADTDTRAIAGVTDAGLGTDALSLSATTSLSQPIADALFTAAEGTGGDITGDNAATQLTRDDLLADPSTEIDRGSWHVLNRSEGEANIGFVVDFGLHLKDVETVARVDDGVVVDSGALSLNAETNGGLVVLRDIDIAEATTPVPEKEEAEDPQTLPGDLPPGEEPVVESKTLPEKRTEKERQLGKIGLGGAFQYVEFDVDTRAELGRLNGAPDLGAVSVTAKNDVEIVGVTKSFGGADNFAFNAGVTIVDYEGSAIATVSDLNRFNADSTTITATDEANIFAFGGAGSQSGKVSFGLGLGLVFADRNAVAALTSSQITPEATTVAASTGASGTIDYGTLALTAKTSGLSVAGSSAGAGGLEKEKKERKAREAEEAGDPPSTDPEDDPAEVEEKLELPETIAGDRADENEEGLGEQKTDGEAPKDELKDQAFGFALAADFSGVFGKNNAVAALATQTDIETDDLTIIALNDAGAIAASGAAVGTGGKIGLAGSAAITGVKTNVLALNTGGSRRGTAGESDVDVLIGAGDKGNVTALAVGRGGSGGSFSIIGSGALNLGRSTVTARSSASDITISDDMAVAAEIEGTSLAVAGSLAAEEAAEARREGLDLPDDVPDEADVPGGDDVPDVPDAGDGSGETPGETPGEGVGEGQQEDESSKTFGLGIVYASTVRPETATAEVTGSDLIADGLSIEAENKRSVIGIAAATGGAPNVAISGSGVVNVLTQNTTARLSGGSVDTPNMAEVDVRATNTAINRGQIGFTGGGSSFGLGISGVALVDRRTTQAQVFGLSQDTSGGATDYTLRATNTGQAHILVTSALASGSADEDEDDSGGSNIAVNIPVSLALTNWDTQALMSGVEMRGLDRINVTAREEGIVSNRQEALTASGDHAGTVGVALTTHTSNVGAGIGDSLIIAGQINVTATSASLLRSVALRDGAAENSVNVITSILKANGETRAEIDETTLTASEINVTATDTTVRDVLTNGFAESAGVGISGGVAVDLYKRDLLARIVGSDVATSDGMYLTASSNMRASNVVIGHNGGDGDFNVQANIAWTTDARDVRAEIVDSNVNAGAEIEMAALRQDQYLSFEGTSGRSSSGAGIGLGVYRFHGTTAAQIIGRGTLDADSNVDLSAIDSTKVLQIAVGVAAGGSFAGTGSIGYVDFGQRPDALGMVTGEDRGVILRDVVEDVVNEGIDFITDNTRLQINEFNLTRDQRILAMIDLDQSTIDVEGDVLVIAKDAREADVVSGQLSLSLDLGFANTLIDKFTIQRNDEGKFRITKRPTAPETEDSAAPQDESVLDTSDDSEGAAAVDEAGGSPSAEGQSNDGGDGGDSDGIALGVGVSWVRFGGTVEAVFDLENAGSIDIAETLTVRALSETNGMTAALGAAFLGTAIGASGAVTRQAQLVRAQVRGAGTLNAGGVGIEGLSDNKMWSIAGALQLTDGFAFGGTLGLTEMNARTQALVSDGATIDAGADGVVLSARDDTRGIGFSAAVSASTGGTAVSASNGIIFSRSAVDALIDPNSDVSSDGSLTVQAQRSQELAGLAFTVAGANSVGVAGGLGLAVDKGVTKATVTNSSINAGNDVAVRASNNTKVVSSAVGIAVGGTVGVTGSVAMTLKQDTVLAEIAGSTTFARDAVLVEAQNGGRLDGVGGADESFFGNFDQASGGIAYGGTAGIGVSVGLIKSTAVVDAAIRGGTTTALSEGPGIITLARLEGTETYLDRVPTWRQGVSVIADNDTTVNTVAVTGALSQGAGIGFQVPIMLINDAVSARIAGNATVNSSSDVAVFAGNATRMRTVSAVVGGGLTVGIGALNELFVISKTTYASIEDSTVIAGRDLSIDAVTPESIRTMSGALGAGVYAGIAGVNQVGVTRSDTQAFSDNATLTAGRDMAIRARAPRQMQQTGASVGIGAVGVGATIMILNSSDIVIAETRAATGIAGRSVLSVGRNLDVLAEAAMLPFGQPHRVQAPSGNGFFNVNQAVIGAGGGLVGIAGAGLYTVSRQSVIARIGAYTTVAAGGTDNVRVRADQSYAQDVFVMSQSGGAVAGGAAAVISTMRNRVLAEIDDNAIVRASGNINVEAYGERSFKGAVVAGGGGVYSFQGSGILLSFGAPIRVTEDVDNIDDAQSAIDQADQDLQRDVYAGNDDPDSTENEGFIIGAGDSLLGALLGESTQARREVSLDQAFNGTDEDAIRTRIGRNAEVRGANVAIGAEEGGTLEVLAGGLSGGAISATHGVALVRRGTAVETIIERGADIRSSGAGNSLAITALADVDDGNPEAIAGSGGLIASGAGVSDIRIGRSVTVDLGADSILRSDGDLILEAREVSATKSKVTAVAVAGIGAGVAVSNAFRDSTIAVNLTHQSGAAPQLYGRDIMIAAQRFGSVEADVDLLAAGAIGIGVTSAIARDRSNVSVHLGGAQMFAATVDVDAVNAGNVTADAKGNVGGLGTTGLNNASANREAITRVTARGADIIANEFDLLATDNDASVTGGRAQVYASTRSTSVSGVSTGGSNAVAKNSSSVIGDLVFDIFDILNDARIETRNESDLEYLSKGKAFGVVGTGVSFARGRDASSSVLDLNFTQQAEIGGTFEAAATGAAYLFGNAVSGKGGLVTAFASDLLLEMRSVTELDISGAGIDAREIILRTDRSFDFESNSDSLAVSLADFGATRQTNSVENTQRLSVGADLSANFVTIASNTEITKRAIDFNGVTGSFGGLNIGALTSRTEVLSDARIELGSATITQRSTSNDPRNDTGFVRVLMNADYDLTDRITGDMGGAVALPHLSSTLLVGDLQDDAAKSVSRIDANGAVIDANGDVTLAVRNDAQMNSETYVRTYGFAGRARAKAHTTFRNDADIALGGGTMIDSRRGTVSLLVGADLNGAQDISQHAEARVFNRTAIPLNSDPDVVATVVQSNAVTVQAGATVLAARDINVNATGGLVDAYAYGSAIDAYSEAAEGVVNFFRGIVGADDVSYERISGTSSVSGLGGITVDGALHAGAYAVSSLQIDFAPGRDSPSDINSASDLIFTEVGDMDYAVQFNVAVGDNLRALINQLTADRNAYAVQNGTQNDTYETLNDQIEALEARLTFLDNTGAGGAVTDFLEFDTLFAAGGNVAFASDYLIGSGSIRATGDAEITVVNNTSLSLTLNDAEIPFESMGEITWRGSSVASNQDLIDLGAGIPLTAFQPAFAQVEAISGSGQRPEIDVRSNYVADGGASADIYVRGDVNNLNGNVTLRSEDGSIYVFGGNIEARSVTIDSGGDFFLAPSDPVTHLTQSPRALNATLFAEQEAYWAQVYQYMTTNRVSQATAISAFNFIGITEPGTSSYTTTTNNGSISALGNIFVYADTLNINGKIQSGITDWELNIASSLDTVLDGLGSGVYDIYLPLRGTPVPDGSDETNLDIIAVNSTLGQRGHGHVTGQNVSLRYNGTTDRLEVGNILTKGGYIELSGKIISTGNGSIKAASGYGRLEVNSASRRDLEFARVDLGPEGGVQGVIKIIDKTKELAQSGPIFFGAPKVYETTTFTALSNGQVRRETNRPGALTFNVNDASYNPSANLALFFTTAEERNIAITDIERTTQNRLNCFVGIGCNLETEAAFITQGQFAPVQLVNKPEVGYIDTVTGGFGGEDYAFLPTRRQLDFEVDSSTGNWITSNILPGVLRPLFSDPWQQRYRDEVTTTSYTERRIYTHRLRADKNIDVDFQGHDSARVEINAAGSVLFDKTVRGASGSLIIDTDGDVAALNSDVVLQTNYALIDAGGSVGGQTASAFTPRTFRVTGPVAARDVFGRRTGADLVSGLDPYRNELIGAAQAVGAPNVLAFGGNETIALEIRAQDEIRVRQLNGTFTLIDEVTSRFGRDVQIEAQGSILVGSLGATVTGGNVSLLSETGVVGDTTYNPYGLSDLKVHAAEKIRAEAEGNIRLHADTGPMQIELVESRTGDVYLNNAGTGGIQDEDRRETADRRAQAGILQALWDELGLIDNASLRSASKGDVAIAVAALERDMAQAYETWWAALTKDEGNGKRVQVADYDPDLVLEADEQERKELATKGLSDAEIDALVQERTQAFHDGAAQYLGDGEYQAEFAYEASDAQINAITAELDVQALNSAPVVAREAQNRTDAYFNWWSALEVMDPATGLPTGTYAEYNKDTIYITFSEARQQQMIDNGFSQAEIDDLLDQRNAEFHAQAALYATDAFDANFAAVLSAQEVATLLDSAQFTTTELEAAFRQDLILPVLDTQITIEEPNVIGRDVTIISASDIGEVIDPIIKTRGQVLTVDDRLTLFSAERSDISFTDNSVIIGRNDDLDIIVRGDLRVDAARHAYVGSEEDVNVVQFRAGEDARLKTAGAITAVGSAADALRGRNVAVEASGGGIGAADAPLGLRILSGGALTARAAGDIHLRARQGDVPIAEVFSPGLVSIRTDNGDIFDADTGSVVDILARDLTLIAGGGNIAALDFEMTETGGEVTAEAQGNTTLTISGGNVDVRRIAAGGQLSLTTTGGGLTLLHPIYEGIDDRQEALEGTTGVALNIAGGITETTTFFGSIITNGLVDIRARGTVGNDTTGLFITADELRLTRATNADNLNAVINSASDLTLSKVLVGEGDVQITTRGALTSTMTGFGAGQLTLRTTGAADTGSDITLEQSLYADSTTPVALEAAGDLVIANGRTLTLGDGGTLQAGRSGQGSIRANGAGTSIRTESGGALVLIAPTDILVSEIIADTGLSMTANGRIFVGQAAAGNIVVDGGTTAQIGGRFDAVTLSLTGDIVGDGTSPVTIGNGRAANPEVTIDANTRARLVLPETGTVQFQNITVGEIGLDIDSTNGGAAFQQAVTSAGSIDVNVGQISLAAPLRSTNGNVTLQTARSIFGAAGSAVRSETGRVTMRAGTTLTARDISSGQTGTGLAIVLAGADIVGSGTAGPDAQTATGEIVLDAGNIGTAAAPLNVQSGTLRVIADGAAHVFSDEAIALTQLIGAGTLYDVMSVKGLILGPNLRTDSKDALVVLTVLDGDITSAANGQVTDLRGEFFLTALNGAITGPDADGFRVRQIEGALSLAAMGDIALSSSAAANLVYAVSNTGDVAITSEGDVTAQLLGSGADPVITAPGTSGDLRWGRSNPLNTAPYGGAGLQSPARYASFAVRGQEDGSDDGNGSTGGNTGGGNTGGGNTGGDNTGGNSGGSSSGSNGAGSNGSGQQGQGTSGKPANTGGSGTRPNSGGRGPGAGQGAGAIAALIAQGGASSGNRGTGSGSGAGGKDPTGSVQQGRTPPRGPQIGAGPTLPTGPQGGTDPAAGAGGTGGQPAINGGRGAGGDIFTVTGRPVGAGGRGAQPARQTQEEDEEEQEQDARESSDDEDEKPAGDEDENDTDTAQNSGKKANEKVSG